VFRELLCQFHSEFLDFLYVATLYYYAQSYGSRFLVFALRVPINVYFDICVLIWTRCHKMSHARDVGGVWLRSTLLLWTWCVTGLDINFAGFPMIDARRRCSDVY
jgi:hypothetical protein